MSPTVGPENKTSSFFVFYFMTPLGELVTRGRSVGGLGVESVIGVSNSRKGVSNSRGLVNGLSAG